MLPRPGETCVESSREVTNFEVGCGGVGTGLLYKRILDHGHADRLYGTRTGTRTDQQAEHAADYLAGCALMPKRLVKRAWGTGTQTPEARADLFDVSPRAAQVRLAQLGLTEPVQRCATAAAASSRRWRPRAYFRSLAASNWRAA